MIALEFLLRDKNNNLARLKTASPIKNNKSEAGAADEMLRFPVRRLVISIQIPATCIVALCMPAILQIFVPSTTLTATRA